MAVAVIPVRHYVIGRYSVRVQRTCSSWETEKPVRTVSY